MGEVKAKVRRLLLNIISKQKLLLTTPAVMAYAEALRITFISSIIFFIIVNVLILPVKLPWLGKERVAADIEESEDEE